MAIRERVTHQIVHGKWDEMMEIEKNWDAIEEEIGGFPKRRRSQPMVGRDGSNVFIWEREYESLSQMEEAYGSYKAYKGDIDTSELLARTNACIANRRTDVYQVLP